MRGGKLRNRFEILENTPTTDEWGHDVVKPTSIGHIWGSVETLTGRELVEAKQIREDVTHKIAMRYDRRLTTKHQLQLNGRVFEITSLNNVRERNDQLEIMATERPT